MNLFSGVLKTNATVRVEQQSTATNSYGYITETYTSIATSVPVSVTITGGARDGRFSSQLDSLSGKIVSIDSVFTNANIRVVFLTGPITGVYGRVENCSQHAPGNPMGLITDTFYRCNWSQVEAT